MFANTRTNYNKNVTVGKIFFSNLPQFKCLTQESQCYKNAAIGYILMKESLKQAHSNPLHVSSIAAPHAKGPNVRQKWLTCILCCRPTRGQP